MLNLIVYFNSIERLHQARFSLKVQSNACVAEVLCAALKTSTHMLCASLHIGNNTFPFIQEFYGVSTMYICIASLFWQYCQSLLCRIWEFDTIDSVIYCVQAN